MYKYSSSNNVDPINEYMYIYIYTVRIKCRPKYILHWL